MDFRQIKMNEKLTKINKNRKKNSFRKKNAHLTKNDFPATIVWGYFFPLRGRRRAAAALLYNVPGRRRVKRRSVRFVCSMSAIKNIDFIDFCCFFCWRGRTSKKRRNRKMDFHRTRKTKKKQTKHTHRGKTSGRAIPWGATAARLLRRTS